MASDSDWPGATIMDPSAIFPILLTVAINEHYLRTLSILVFYRNRKKIFLEIKHRCSTWARLCDANKVAIFGEKLVGKFSDLTTCC